MMNVLKRCVVALLLAVGVLAGSPASSYAVAPFALPDGQRVVARNADLSRSDQSKLQDAAREVQQRFDIHVYFVLVDTYDGRTPAAWTEEVVELSRISDPHTVIITVAAQQRDLYIAQGGILTTPQLQTIMKDYLIPSLQQEGASWGNMGAAVVSGLDRVLSSPTPDTIITSEESTSIGLGAFALVLLVAGGCAIYYFVQRFNRKKRTNAAAQHVLDNPQWDSPNPLGAVPLNHMHQRSKEVLIATDNAIRQANQAVLTARQEFGASAVEQYQTALQKAAVHLRQAFTLRQELDDAFPETQQQQHRMLTELLRHCDMANTLMKSNAEQFAQMRDIMADPQARIANLTLRVVEARARIEPAHQTLAALQERYKQLNLETIEANILGADENIALAEDSLTNARDGLKHPTRDYSPVAPAIVQAEKLLTQAERLLTAVDHADEDIAHAQANLPRQKDELKKTLAEAATFLASPLAKNSSVNVKPVQMR